MVLHLGCTSWGHSGGLHGGRGLRMVPVYVAGMGSWIEFLEGEREVLSASPPPSSNLVCPSHDLCSHSASTAYAGSSQ